MINTTNSIHSKKKQQKQRQRHIMILGTNIFTKISKKMDFTKDKTNRSSNTTPTKVNSGIAVRIIKAIVSKTKKIRKFKMREI